MLDASGSIQGEANFKLCIDFIKVVFHAFGMGGGIRFALVIFGSSAQVVFDFSKYSSISDVDAASAQVSTFTAFIFFSVIKHFFSDWRLGWEGQIFLRLSKS